MIHRIVLGCLVLLAGCEARQPDIQQPPAPPDSERTVEYTRHEFHGDPEQRSAPLHAFFFDIPYLGACNVFPPLHLLNQRLMSGGGDGGMSPGASWKPFTITQQEFDAVLPRLLKPDTVVLKRYARYPTRVFVTDSSFDSHTDYFDWLAAVCRKHRAR